MPGSNPETTLLDLITNEAFDQAAIKAKIDTNAAGAWGAFGAANTTGINDMVIGDTSPLKALAEKSLSKNQYEALDHLIQTAVNSGATADKNITFTALMNTLLPFGLAEKYKERLIPYPQQSKNQFLLECPAEYYESSLYLLYGQDPKALIEEFKRVCESSQVDAFKLEVITKHLIHFGMKINNASFKFQAFINRIEEKNFAELHAIRQIQKSHVEASEARLPLTDPQRIAGAIDFPEDDFEDLGASTETQEAMTPLNAVSHKTYGLLVRLANKNQLEVLTPLFLHCKFDPEGVITHLREQIKNPDSPLNIIKHLLDKIEQGADVLSDLLILAAEQGKPQIVKLLLEKGAKHSPKHFVAAVQGRSIEALRLLLDQKSDLYSVEALQDSFNAAIRVDNRAAMREFIRRAPAYGQYLQEKHPGEAQFYVRDLKTPVNTQEIPVKKMVFQGGGVKGTAFAGATQAMREANLLEDDLDHIEETAGTSAGAISAFLVGLGYSIEDFHQATVNQNMLELQDENIEGLVQEAKGIFSGNITSFAQLTYRYPLAWGAMADVSKINKQYKGLCKGDAFKRFAISRLAQRITTSNTYYIENAGNVPEWIHGLPTEFGKLTAEQQSIVDSAALLHKLDNGGIWPTGPKMEDQITRYAGLLGLDEDDRVALLNRAYLANSATFQDLYSCKDGERYPFKKMRFYVTNISTFESEECSVDTTPDMTVVSAVRGSMSIPVFFEPIEKEFARINGEGKREVYKDPNHHVIMDGGVLNNDPIFPDNDETTINLSLSMSDKSGFTTEASLGAMLKKMISGFMDNVGKTLQHERNRLRTFSVAHGTNALAFDIDDNQKQAIIQRGHDSVADQVERYKVFRKSHSVFNDAHKGNRGLAILQSILPEAFETNERGNNFIARRELITPLHLIKVLAQLDADEIRIFLESQSLQVNFIVEKIDNRLVGLNDYLRVLKNNYPPLPVSDGFIQLIQNQQGESDDIDHTLLENLSSWITEIHTSLQKEQELWKQSEKLQEAEREIARLHEMLRQKNKPVLVVDTVPLPRPLVNHAEVQTMNPVSELTEDGKHHLGVHTESIREKLRVPSTMANVDEEAQIIKTQPAETSHWHNPWMTFTGLTGLFFGTIGSLSLTHVISSVVLLGTAASAGLTIAGGLLLLGALAGTAYSYYKHRKTDKDIDPSNPGFSPHDRLTPNSQASTTRQTFSNTSIKTVQVIQANSPVIV